MIGRREVRDYLGISQQAPSQAVVDALKGRFKGVVVVGGALRSIALDEAPLGLRAAAQGLVNICNAIGTLLAAAAVSAIADFGGGVAGFAAAYRAVAIVMLAALLLSLRLRRGHAAAERS